MWFQHKMVWRCDISGLKDVPFLKSKAGFFFLCLYYAFTTNLANIQMQHFSQEFNILSVAASRGRHGGIWPQSAALPPACPPPPPPPPRRKKWSKSAIFNRFFPLRNAFCPLDAPQKMSGPTTVFSYLSWFASYWFGKFDKWTISFDFRLKLTNFFSVLICRVNIILGKSFYTRLGKK